MKTLAVLLPLALAACSSPTEKLAVTDAQINLPAVSGNPGAAYFTVHGGPTDMRLMTVTSPQVVRTEMHDMVMTGGVMSMPKLESGIAVPAGGEVKFEPMGRHVMLFDINPKAQPGDKVKLSLVFADGFTLDTQAAVKAAGDTGDAHMGGH